MNDVLLYPRRNGSWGVRNRIAVISTVACANHVAESIAAAVPLADAYTHPYGCDQLGDDLRLSAECLRKMAVHANNGAALIVGLGCEEILADELCRQVSQEQPSSAYLIIQEQGGTSRSIAAGVEICQAFSRQLADDRRQPAPLSSLVIGLECGGSDFSSGLAANPVMGRLSERLSQVGARLIFGETAELMGAEEILRQRCLNRSDYEFICDKIRRVEQVAREMKVDLRGAQPSPGNIAGGLSTIEEKSLGGVCKIGSCPINATLEFAQSATAAGVSFMDTPGNDLACSLGLCCGGAVIILFSTGRGTPLGFAAAPLLKLTANSSLARSMAENIDLDLSPIISGHWSLEHGADQLFAALLATANGRETAAERLGHREFSLYRISPILT